MPKYTVTCRGSLEVARKDYPSGSIVELSAEKAASLPPGTVELVRDAPVELGEVVDTHMKKKGAKS